MDTIGKILILADADTPLGVGYSWRCVSLASVWVRMGGRVTFAGNNLPATLHRKIVALGCELIENEHFGKPDCESRVINELLRNRQSDFLVLDGERFDQHLQSHLQLSGTRLVVIENWNRQAGLAITDLNSVGVPLVYHGLPRIFLDSQPARPSDRCQAIMIRARDDLPETRITELVVDANDNQGLGNQLTFKTSSVNDGNDAERIARRLAVQQFRFRSASMEDAELLHRWRNDPEVRASCFQTQCVSLESHRQWLGVKLGSNNSEVRMIEDRNSNSVGSLSLDYDRKSKHAELNIQITPSLRGCGLGTAFVESACAEVIAKYPEYQVIARIKSGNLIAQSAFQKAGFRKVASTTTNGQVAIQFSYVPDKPSQQIEPGILNRRINEGNWRQAS